MRPHSDHHELPRAARLPNAALAMAALAAMLAMMSAGDSRLPERVAAVQSRLLLSEAEGAVRAVAAAVAGAVNKRVEHDRLHHVAFAWPTAPVTAASRPISSAASEARPVVAPRLAVRELDLPPPAV